MFSGKSVRWVKLRIAPNRARWASGIVWHSRQKASFDSEGHYLLEFPYSDDRELMKDILGLLPDAEIIAPESLRERLREILAKNMRKLAV